VLQPNLAIQESVGIASMSTQMLLKELRGTVIIRSQEECLDWREVSHLEDAEHRDTLVLRLGQFVVTTRLPHWRREHPFPVFIHVDDTHETGRKRMLNGSMLFSDESVYGHTIDREALMDTVIRGAPGNVEVRSLMRSVCDYED
jgi:hypothetical protein